MGTYSYTYTGAYIQIPEQIGDTFKLATVCSASCQESLKGLSKTSKFCPHCGAKAEEKKVLAGRGKIVARVPDERSNDIFMPEYLDNHEDIDAWLPNGNGMAWGLNDKESVDFTPNDVIQCLENLKNSEEGRWAIKYLTEQGLEHRICFGTITYYS